MNKIAIFGKPGGGKSTLSRKISAVTGINFYPFDLIKYKQNVVPHSIPIEEGCEKKTYMYVKKISQPLFKQKNRLEQ